jgi:DNA-binding transcriptional regulator YhcF (GntR family)
LVDEGILYKKRGVGMFVTTGARKQIIGKRKVKFYEDYIMTMLIEAEKLGISKEDIAEMLKENKSY